MPTKTISLELDAYERLRAAKRTERESFSEVVRRAIWPEDGITGADLLKHSRERSAFLSEATLRRIERLPDSPPDDPWAP